MRLRRGEPPVEAPVKASDVEGEALRWESRVVGHGEVSPDQLLANPRNWRIHPQHQRAALEAVLDRVGWLRPVIVNNVTGHVVDGHLRVGLALSREEATVPVTYVELSENEERAILATHDPLAELAMVDQAAYEALRDEVGLDELAALQAQEGKAPLPKNDEEDEARLARQREVVCPYCSTELLWDGEETLTPAEGVDA